MIESTVITLLLLVSGGLFLAMRIMAQNARNNPAAERARLQQSLVWHEERLRNAQEKNWDHDMIARITAQVEETRQRLAQLAS
ncbi:MAG TPA: hypothetical protein VF388_05085 [Lacunisphaera sp.]